MCRGWIVVAVLLLNAIVACAASPLLPHDPVRLEHTHPAMGTLFRFVIYAPDRSCGIRALSAACDRIDGIEATLSDWIPDSPARRLGEVSGRPREVHADLFRVLVESDRAHDLTGGAFDPSVAPLTRIWRRAIRQDEAPDPDQIDRARRTVGWEHVRLDENVGTVELALPDMAFDFGGIGKGWALDRALEVLASHGIERALVDGGGDIAVRAPPPGSEGWLIEIPGQERLILAHAAVATSGSRYRSVSIDGVSHGHIVDPRSGRGVTGDISATVVAPDGALADAMASALCIAGREGLVWIEGLADTEAEVRLPGNPPHLHRSTGFAARLH